MHKYKPLKQPFSPHLGMEVCPGVDLSESRWQNSKWLIGSVLWEHLDLTIGWAASYMKGGWQTQTLQGGRELELAS